MFTDEFPRTLPEFNKRFRSEEACWDYLVKARWPNGFACPKCKGTRACLLSAGLFECWACKRQTSVTAGTIFHGTRKPLMLWFQAAFLMTTQKGGVSAKTLERVLGLSYETAWTWLQKLRLAMGQRARGKLRGRVEVDETMVGGLEKGMPGRSIGNKSIVFAAVENRGLASGRLRLELVPDVTSKTLCDATAKTVARKSRVKTDAYPSYGRLKHEDFDHLAVACGGERSSEELPHVHRVFSLLKRVFLGTYQGSIGEKHLTGYLQEFEFRFNRRRAAHRTMLTDALLHLAIAAPPCTQRHFIEGRAWSKAA